MLAKELANINASYLHARQRARRYGKSPAGRRMRDRLEAKAQRERINALRGIMGNHALRFI